MSGSRFKTLHNLARILTESVEVRRTRFSDGTQVVFSVSQSAFGAIKAKNTEERENSKKISFALELRGSFL